MHKAKTLLLVIAQFGGKNKSVSNGQQNGDYVVYPTNDGNHIRRYIHREKNINQSYYGTDTYIQFVLRRLLHEEYWVLNVNN